jgi:hypothetical protein
VSGAPPSPDVVDLGGCDGCALGCAVTCASGRPDRPRSARRVLVSSGLAAAVLALGPGLVARHPVWSTTGVATALVGLLVAALAAVALRRGRPAGDGPARAAYRLLGLAVVGVVATVLGAVVARLT